MSTQINPPVYDIAVPIEGPFTPPPASHDSMTQVAPVENQGEGMHIYPPPASQGSQDMTQVAPVYTSGGGGAGSGLNTEDGKRIVVSSPGMTTCIACQMQVMPNITHKPGTYSWLMGTLFFILGLATCMYAFFGFCMMWAQTMDTYHTCPHCNKVLYIEKKKCCK